MPLLSCTLQRWSHGQHQQLNGEPLEAEKCSPLTEIAYPSCCQEDWSGLLCWSSSCIKYNTSDYTIKSPWNGQAEGLTNNRLQRGCHSQNSKYWSSKSLYVCPLNPPCWKRHSSDQFCRDKEENLSVPPSMGILDALKHPH